MDNERTVRKRNVSTKEADYQIYRPYASIAAAMVSTKAINSPKGKIRWESPRRRYKTGLKERLGDHLKKKRYLGNATEMAVACHAKVIEN